MVLFRSLGHAERPSKRRHMVSSFWGSAEVELEFWMEVPRYQNWKADCGLEPDEVDACDQTPCRMFVVLKNVVL